MALLTTNTGMQEAIDYINGKNDPTSSVAHDHSGIAEFGKKINSTNVLFSSSGDLTSTNVKDALDELNTKAKTALALPKVPVRQTVLDAYTDNDGNPGYIAAATGLNLNVFATAKNIILTVAGGFDQNGQVDRIGKVSADTTITGLIGSKTISSLSYTGTTANCTTASSHGLVTGTKIVVAGSTPSDYNGTYNITVTGTNTFTYTMTTTPSANATGASYTVYNYIYADINSSNVVSFGHSLLEPIVQYKGSVSVTNGQYTFDSLQMKGFLGNGSSVGQVWRLFLGNAVCNSSSVGSVSLNRICSDQTNNGILNSNGWKQFGDGLIIQWGNNGPVGHDETINITFPIVFPNKVLNIQGTLVGTTPHFSSAGEDCIYSSNTSGFTYAHGGDSYGLNIYWYAIGY